MNKKIAIIAAVLAASFAVTACNTTSPDFKARDQGESIDRSPGKGKTKG